MAKVGTLLLVSAAAALLIALHKVTPPANGLWQQTALNSSHVFVFALVALAFLSVTARLNKLSIWQQFLAALLTALMAGAASEAAQINTLRDASVEDLMSNWLGAAAALLLATAFRRELSAGKWSRIALLGSGVVVLVVALFPLLKVSAAYVERNADTASIVSSGDFFFRTFALPQNASLSVLQTNGRKIARIDLSDGAWPGVVFHDVWPDWNAYSSLVVELSLPDAEPLTVHVRVHDRAHRVGEQPYNDRFNVKHELTPGRNTVRIPLDTVRNAPSGRQMDMSQIDGIVLFCASKNAGRRFDLIGIRLE